MFRLGLSRWGILLVSVGTLTACADEVAGPSESNAVALPSIAAAVTSVPCPATAPPGYTVVFCFNFATIPGTWHGFLLGSSTQPTAPGAQGQLSAEYLLLSPMGAMARPSGGPVDVNLDGYTFQSEFNGVVWNDVFRIVTSAREPSQLITVAVAKRAPVPLTSAPCPPAIPAGYESVTCFAFTTIPGTWHGFIVGRSLPPAAEGDAGQLGAEYVLVSPSGLPSLVPGAFVDVTQPGHLFQPEFNGTVWNDVLRVVTPVYGPARSMTIAVVRRELTPALQLVRIGTQLEQLLAAGELSAAHAGMLAGMLETAASLADAGRPVPASQLLRAFTIRVEVLMSRGNDVLPPAQGTRLIEQVNAVIARLAST